MKKMVLIAALCLVAAFAFAQWKDGVYAAKEPNPDKLGFTADIKITVKGGAIAKIEYNESKGKASKWSDASYNANMKKVTGVSWAEAVQALEASLQKSSTVEGVDAVSGATELSARFKELAAAALAKAK